eukprot:723370-Pelagomonas_calceolata.AAC.1
MHEPLAVACMWSNCQLATQIMRGQTEINTHTCGSGAHWCSLLAGSTGRASGIRATTTPSRGAAHPAGARP